MTNTLLTQYDNWGGHYTSPTAASGRAYFDVPAYTFNHSFQRCTTPTVTWTATRTSGRPHRGDASQGPRASLREHP